jgi:hypothetical protein
VLAPSIDLAPDLPACLYFASSKLKARKADDGIGGQAMAAKLLGAWAVVVLSIAPAAGQAPPVSGGFLPAGQQPPAAQQPPARAAAGQPAANAGQWRNPADTAGKAGRNPAGLDDGTAAGAIEPLKSISQSPRRPLAKVMPGPATLPNEQGQVWREYDISPYTLRVTSTNRAEQAVVDWILRETGYEAWHSEPLGILCANHRTVKVYHTPEIHAVVSDVIDRFVNSEAESQAFGVHVITLGHPNWRAKAHAVLKPVAVQTQGIQAWLLEREDAALVLADMRKRFDFREHSSPHLVMNNGQTATVVATRAQNYTRDVLLRPQAWPNFEPEVAQLDEGFSLELNPLLSLDGHTVDAVVKCNIDQLEKLVPVMLDVPSPAAPRQRTKIEVPQITHCRLHERFRWPTDQVLLVSLGVVASPATGDTNSLLKNIPVIGTPSRADLLVFVESKGAVTAQTPGVGPAAVQTGQRNTNTYRGRY